VSSVPEPPAERLWAVEQRLVAAAVAAGRTRSELTLVAVSKTRPAADVAALADLGVRNFGESRWQELGPKSTELSDCTDWALRWHFVGGLQRNKARAVAQAAYAVHSVDRQELCVPLARGAEGRAEPLEVFVQVSLDGDPSRGGVEGGGVPALADAVATHPELRLAGLMAVAPVGVPPRPAFARLREMGERMRSTHPGATALSAGMSGDLEEAVAEGATHLRIGTALFGSRA
jgi:pyridoxal phosphate enzyme (YggS family)